MKASSMMSTLCIVLAVMCYGCEATTYVQLLPFTREIVLYSTKVQTRTRTNSEGDRIGYQKILVYSSTTVSSVSWDLETITFYPTRLSIIVEFFTTTVTNPTILLTLESTTATMLAITTVSSTTTVKSFDIFITLSSTTNTVHAITTTQSADTGDTPEMTSTLSIVSTTASTSPGYILTSNIAPSLTILPSAGILAVEKPISNLTRILLGVLVPFVSTVIALAAYTLNRRIKKRAASSAIKERIAELNSRRQKFPGLPTRSTRDVSSSNPVRPPRPKSLTPSVMEAMKDPQINSLLKNQIDGGHSLTPTRSWSTQIGGNQGIRGSGGACHTPTSPGPTKALLTSVASPVSGTADPVVDKKVPEEEYTTTVDDQATRMRIRQTQFHSRESTCSPVELEAEQILVARISKINAEKKNLERGKALAVLEGRSNRIADEHSSPTSSVYSRDESGHETAFEKRAEEEKRERDYYQGRAFRPSQGSNEVLEGGNGFF